MERKGAKHKGWLHDALSQALGWDQTMLQSLVDTVCCAAKRADVEELVQNFLPGEDKAIALIDEYFASQQGVPSQQTQAMAQAEGWTPYIKSADDAKAGGARQQQPPSQQQQQQPQQQEKVLGMFKQGGRLRPSAGHVVAGGQGGTSKSGQVKPERQIVNCLGCGKIYDTRADTSDVARFLDKGGVCTFCGDRVALTYHERGMQYERDATSMGAGSADENAAPGSSGAGGPAMDAATAAAVEFKNRLVQYDRESSKRTAVIDDQSDYFEIDTNAWLTDQERAELRRRRQLEEAAAAAKKNRVTVTIDLIGRKVLVPSASTSSPSFETSTDMATARAEAAAAEAKAAAATAAASGSGQGLAPIPAPGPAASADEIARATAALREMRMVMNPAFATMSPAFLPSASGRGAAKGANGGSSKRMGPEQGARQQRRLQGDLFEEFEEFGKEVVYADVLAAAVALDQSKPFDLCDPELAAGAQGAAPLRGPKAAAAATMAQRLQSPASALAVPPLPRGMALLKGYLSVSQQAALVSELRELGRGTGGFYTPSYRTGGRLHLRMMCLGWHWEPRKHSYEATRSEHDGATPPPIPDSLLKMVEAIIADANRASGYTQPGPFRPDVCLANFYEQTGHLGYHQDKDESSESLRKGLPVVSISIGDEGDMKFGDSPDEAAASTVRLQSGDVMVFGGPSRMAFHSIPKIYPGTAPQELLQATGLRPGRLNLTLRQIWV